MKTVNNILLAILFVLFLAAFSSGASFSDRSSVSRITYQQPPSFQSYYSGEGRLDTYWPILGDREQCEARQDILLSISPAGCTPAS